MKFNWQFFSDSRHCFVVTLILVCATLGFSRLFVGEFYGTSFHFQNVWFSSLVWCMLAAATCASWIWYLHLKIISKVDKRGDYWVKFGASSALLGLFMLWALTIGSLDYYFATLTCGEDRVHQHVETIELNKDTKLVLYWCIEPPLSPCILILAVQKQLPFGLENQAIY